MLQKTPAVLVLADGSVFRGCAIGADGQTVGEVVFNTSMTGYQEILTDPSYAGQIVTLTYPHIGNTGANPEDEESRDVYAAGLIIRDLPLAASNWRKQEDLPAYLRRHGVVAIGDIDTRRLTRLLRSKGAQNGCIQAGRVDEKAALEAARAAPSMAGLDLAQKVSIDKAYHWNQSLWARGTGYRQVGAARFHVVAFDYGVKHNILRNLAERGCKVTVLPARSSAQDALALEPDGVFLSNGPGDPAATADYAVPAIQGVLERRVPVFGICLGHQLLALALGAKTYKLRMGHRGANQPVKDLATGKVEITSQNHGFAVDDKSLPANARVTHVSLFDGSNEGIAATDIPAFSVQYHPEASPGPTDSHHLFHRFVALIEKNKGEAKA
ncbi:MAG TPA: glutamine-hydrolyzing carbamoyl-phosphate synthase small subunit [Acetobacteraceae bacterium]|nr:glutamine-hydrolyzing carbamoyl-phosphate synthase small subunit [Acetobacteraceae bacterium]